MALLLRISMMHSSLAMCPNVFALQMKPLSAQWGLVMVEKVAPKVFVDVAVFFNEGVSMLF
jgi:hypothetical protein